MAISARLVWKFQTFSEVFMDGVVIIVACPSRLQLPAEPRPPRH